MGSRCIFCGNELPYKSKDSFRKDRSNGDDKLCPKCKDGLKKTVKEVVAVEEFDAVNKPKHYTDKNIEVIEYIVDTVADPKSYCIGNVLKYVSRYDRKDNAVQDLEKARYYLNKTIEIMKAEGSK